MADYKKTAAVLISGCLDNTVFAFRAFCCVLRLCIVSLRMQYLNIIYYRDIVQNYLYTAYALF